MSKIEMMKAALRAVWQLCTYLSVGLPIFLVLLITAPFIGRSNTVLNVWIWFDRLVATVVHFTWKRTISGLTGQYMTKKLRYKYQAKVIDFLAKLCGDTPNHCERAYRWEQSIKVIK